MCSLTRNHWNKKDWELNQPVETKHNFMYFCYIWICHLLYNESCVIYLMYITLEIITKAILQKLISSHVVFTLKLDDQSTLHLGTSAPIALNICSQHLREASCLFWSPQNHWHKPHTTFTRLHCKPWSRKKAHKRVYYGFAVCFLFNQKQTRNKNHHNTSLNPFISLHCKKAQRWCRLTLSHIIKPIHPCTLHHIHHAVLKTQCRSSCKMITN